MQIDEMFTRNLSDQAVRLYKDLQAALDEVPEVPCQSAPDLYFSEDDSTGSSQLRIARNACYSCPVLSQCLAYAIEANEPFGVWGGTYASERKKLNRSMRQARLAS